MRKCIRIFFNVGVTLGCFPNLTLEFPEGALYIQGYFENHLQLLHCSSCIFQAYRKVWCEYVALLPKKGPKSVFPVWLPHLGRCAPAGGASPRTAPPGWLCTLPVGPGSAAGCARPPLCRPQPSGPPPGSAPAPAAAAASVCSRLRTTFKAKKWDPDARTLHRQNRSRMGAHTGLWLQLELSGWVPGSFLAPLWGCLSLHEANTLLFGALRCCSKERGQTRGDADTRCIG